MSRLETLLQHLLQDDKEPFIYFAIAKEYEGLGLEKEAEDYYRKLISLNADYVGTYYHLGKLYENQDKCDLALDIFEKGINIAKKQSDFHSLSELMNAKQNLEII